MGQTRLRRLRARHFRSFKGEVEFTFPDRGLVLVKSQNQDTGGSSGGGKSSFLMALNAALDICPFPMTQLQSWGVEEPLSVTIELDTDSGPVIRSIGAKNSLKIGDARALSGAKVIKEKVQEILGLTPEMLLALTYSPQQDQNDFLSLTNSEKQEFLSVLLGTQKLEAVVEAAQKESSKLSGCMDQAQEKLLACMEEVSSAELFLASTEALQPTEAAQEAIQEAQERVLLADEALTNLKARVGTQEVERRKQFAQVGQEHREPIDRATEAVGAAQQVLTDVALAVPTVPYNPSGFDAKIKLGQKKLQELTQEDAKLETAHRAQQQQLDTEIATLKAYSRAISERAAKVVDLQREIERLKQSICPTCEQQWLDAKIGIEVKEKEVAALFLEVDQLTQAQQRIPQLEADRAAHHWQPNPLIAQVQGAIQKLQTEKAAYDAQVSAEARQVKAEHDLKVAEARTKVANAKTVLAQVEQQRTAALNQVDAGFAAQRQTEQQKLQVAEKALSDARYDLGLAQNGLATIQQANGYRVKEKVRLEAAVSRAKGLYQSAVLSATVWAENLAAEMDFIKLVGREGFMGSIFDEVLAEISQETNLILGRVANTGHVTLEFRSEVESKEGKVRKEIRPVVWIGGYEADLRAGCSGGMFSAVRLAVRIAVRRVISRRTGSFPCWMCLDESFDGLDPVSKEACMEILSEAAQEDLILVVDHSTEFKALFAKTIDLEYRNGTTTVAS